MLEKIREGSQGGAAKIILGAVILSFALSGVYSYLGSGGQVNAASVNGEDITRYDLEKELQNEQNRMRQQMGEMFDSLASNTAYMNQVRTAVLERMIAERLIDQKAKELGLRVSAEQIKQAIVSMPEFQVEGKFDNDRYQAILRQVNMTADQLANMLSRDMVRQQLMRSLLGTDIVTTEEAMSILALQQQQREFSYTTVSKSDFTDSIEIADSEVQSFYDKNLDRFATPEQVALEYVELNVADMAKDVAVTDEEVQSYYDAHSASYQMPERRLAAMILIEGDDRAKAEAVLARLNAGEDFATVAKEASDDFSAENGGELDWFEAGAMGGDFDAALFGQEKGQYSEIIDSDFGFQIILTKDIESGSAAPLSDVRDEIVAAVQNELAQERFYELQQLLADVSFQVPENLEDAAAEVGAEVKTTELFSRFNAPAAVNNQRVINAAFSDAVILDNMNSDIIELESGHVMVVRAKEHKAAGTMPLAEVSEQIKAQLVAEAASEKAKVAADEKLAQLKSGTALEGMTLVAAVGRNGTPELDPRLVGEVFAMPKPVNGASNAAVEMSNGDYAIVSLTKVIAGEPEAAIADSLKLRLANTASQSQYQALIATLRAGSDVSYPVVAEQ